MTEISTPAAPPPRFAGIDTGEACWIAVRERAGGGEDGAPRWVYFEAPPLEALTERCAAVFNHLGVEAAVIDGGPHTRAAREVHDLLPDGCFIWRHTQSEDMTTKWVEFLGTERRHVRISREEILAALVEEFHSEGPRLPTPRGEEEERLLSLVDTHLINLRKKQEERSGGQEVEVFAKNENHFGLACAYAKLAEQLAHSEGVIGVAAGGYAGQGPHQVEGALVDSGEPGLTRPRLPELGWAEDSGSYARQREIRGLNLR